jgi:predicted RND superfamily exporter protein
VISAPLRWPGSTLGLVALLTMGMGAAAAGVRFDNTPETWLPATGTGLEAYERFRDRFGEDSLIVAFTGEARLDDPDWRRSFVGLAERLRALDGVGAVVAPFDEGGLANGSGSPLAPHLVNAASAHAGMAIFPADGLDAAARSRLVADIEARVDEWKQHGGGAVQLAGADVITHDLDLGSARSLGRLSPLVLLTMVVVFYGATRSRRAVGAMLLAAVAGGIWTVGLVALADRSLNLVIVTMPAIIAVVTAAQAMHLISAFQRLDPSDASPADTATRSRWWRAAIADTWRPCLLSAVTTAAGFASLATSEVPPIRDLGVFTAVGVLFAFALTFSVIPALLCRSASFRPKPPVDRRWTPARAAALAAFLRRHAAAVVATAVVVSGLCAAGLGTLQLESHILTFFPPDHRVPRSYRAIESNLLALTPFELTLEGPRGEVLSAETFAALDGWVDGRLEAEPLLRQAISPAVADAGTPALRAAALRAALPEQGDALTGPLRRFVWVSGDDVVLRTTLTSETSSSNACHALAERLRSALAGVFPGRVAADITGGATLLIHGQVLLLDTQVRSFALALLAVTAVIVVAFRSPGIVLISLLPNLMPIALTLGAMGLLGIPLNTATVTVAGIALGLIVDDTIHLIHRYGSARRRGLAVSEAVADTLYTVGRPVLVTSAAVAAGFAAFVLSPFRPTLFFGLLIALASVSAVVCDLVVLPALLQLRDRYAPRAG